MLVEDHNRKKIILASASPRRKKIFKLLSLDFEVIKPTGHKEKQFKRPYDTVVYNSTRKAENVFNYVKVRKLKKNIYNYPGGFLIAGFDTIVYLKGRYLGKPLSNEQAKEYLRFLSGRTHMVVSGVCILDTNTENYRCGFEVTKVKFRNLSPLEIEDYIKKEYVLDKAGAYNIYGMGSMLVEKINGCFFNVAGLPVSQLIDLLKEFDYKILG